MRATTINVINPALLTWARERAGLDSSVILEHFPHFQEWESGAKKPTLRQLEKFAKFVHVAIGYLFLPKPPIENLPIADFRTIGSQPTRRPSPNLLDTIYLCQQRQEWYRNYARDNNLPACEFVGSATLNTNIVEVSRTMRDTIAFSLEEQQSLSDWEKALRQFTRHVEDAGVLVMSNSMVENNRTRKLCVEEFRGFALSDPLAPLIFLNAADSKAARMFTLAHELAHLWLGDSGVSIADMPRSGVHSNEAWCNAVAAEFLVPREVLESTYEHDKSAEINMRQMARKFKVSTLVILYRMLDAQLISDEKMRELYRTEMAQAKTRHTNGGGKIFYSTLRTRIGNRFANALVINTLEGHTLFQDAFNLLSLKKTESFYSFARSLGVMS